MEATDEYTPNLRAGVPIPDGALVAGFVPEPDEPDLFSVGLVTKRVRVTPSEALLHARECAWAREFDIHHPAVGYLVACSTEVVYRAFNAYLRLQRTSMLMEGGEICDFRIYDIDLPNAYTTIS